MEDKNNNPNEEQAKILFEKGMKELNNNNLEEVIQYVNKGP
jgi:hypothetical protein